MEKILIFLIKVYKKILSLPLEVLFGKACRFTPSCSAYTIEALEKFGAVKGTTLGMSRFLKCHPWGGSGFDPVPELTKN